MPEPTNFGQGLSIGIFDALTKRQLEQREKDTNARKEKLTLLGSLLDQATPETQPLILQQMGEVMGFKGKQRSIWQQLTGSNMGAYEESLNARMSELLGNYVPEAQYEKLRTVPTLSKAPTDIDPTSLFPIFATEDQTKGKVALKDPYKEKLNMLRAQYGLQTSAAMDRMREKEQLIGERQLALEEERTTNRKEVDSQRALLKAQGDVLKRAVALAGGPGMPITEDNYAVAAEQVATEYNLKPEQLKANLGLTKARTKLAEAETASLGAMTDPVTGAALPGAGMKPGERLRFDQSQQQAATAAYTKWAEAKGRVDAAFSQIQSLRQKLTNSAKAQNASFDEARGTFVSNVTGQPIDPILLRIGGADRELAELTRLRGEADRAKAEVEAGYNTLKTQYGNYYRTGSDIWQVAPNPSFGGVSAAGSPRTGAAPIIDATTPKTRTPDISESLTINGTLDKPASSRRVGEVFSYAGKRYKIVEVQPPSPDYPHGRIITMPVR